jgi:Zn-finger nucleic acid-binding protein
MREDGYDKEEEYFYRKNKELLDKKRSELDAQRQTQASAQLKAQHWMRCPKCGSEMAEEDLSSIKVDRCKGCGGIFFDAGELELLLQSQEPAGFLGGLRKWMKK